MVYFKSSTLPLAGGSNVNIWIILINSDIIDDTYKLKQRTQAMHSGTEAKNWCLKLVQKQESRFNQILKFRYWTRKLTTLLIRFLSVFWLSFLAENRLLLEISAPIIDKFSVNKRDWMNFLVQIQVQFEGTVKEPFIPKGFNKTVLPVNGG